MKEVLADAPLLGEHFEKYRRLFVPVESEWMRRYTGVPQLWELGGIAGDGTQVVPYESDMLLAFSVFGYIKNPNHLRAEDGWDDNRNFYAFRRQSSYLKLPVKAVEAGVNVIFPFASSVPITCDVVVSRVLVPVITIVGAVTAAVYVALSLLDILNGMVYPT
jgi:hypothetical protein